MPMWGEEDLSQTQRQKRDWEHALRTTLWDACELISLVSFLASWWAILDFSRHKCYGIGTHSSTYSFACSWCRTFPRIKTNVRHIRACVLEAWSQNLTPAMMIWYAVQLCLPRRRASTAHPTTHLRDRRPTQQQETDSTWYARDATYRRHVISYLCILGTGYTDPTRVVYYCSQLVIGPFFVCNES